MLPLLSQGKACTLGPVRPATYARLPLLFLVVLSSWTVNAFVPPAPPPARWNGPPPSIGGEVAGRPRCKRNSRVRCTETREEDSGGDGRLALPLRRELMGRVLSSMALPFLLRPPLLVSGAVPAAETEVDSDEEPTQCRNGALVPEDKVPGAYQQVCMSLPRRSLRLRSTGEKITVYQGTVSTGGSGGGTVAGRTGVAVWNSCLLLTRFLDALSLSDPSFLEGKTVLELGCGTALASIASAKLGAGRVVATDGNPEVVDLARANLDRNGLLGAGGKGEAAEMRWGILDASEYYDEADVIIGSDLTYNSGSWKVLAETVGSVLKPGGVFVYVTLGHAGFSTPGELGGFLTVARGEGLVTLEERTEGWPLGGTTAPLSSILNGCFSPRERALFHDTGGAGVVFLGKKRSKRLT